MKIETLALTDQLKVTWNGSLSGEYLLALSIDPTRVASAAAAVRRQLESLSRWALTSDPATRWNQLLALAQQGKQLRYVLFHDRTQRAEVRELETWLAEEYEAGDNSLTIYANAGIQVPWGLVYDGELPKQPPPPGLSQEETLAAEIDQFKGFWSLKYGVSSTHQNRTRLRTARPAETFGLLSLVNRDVFDGTRSEFLRHTCPYCSPTREPLGIADSLETCFDRLDHSDKIDILFHYFGHHHDGTLDLGRRGTVSYEEFSRLIDALAEREESSRRTPCGLLFLNGCETAVGSGEMKLRALAMRPELCGAIATEAIVRRQFAGRFGPRLLHEMICKGSSVAQTMQKLWHDTSLWPESLLYGCYAHQSYHIAPQSCPPQMTGSEIPEERRAA